MDNVEYRLWMIGGSILSIIVGFSVSAFRKQRIIKLKNEQHKKNIQFNIDKQPIVLYLRAFDKDGIKETQVPLRWGFNVTSPIDSFEMKLDGKIQSIGQFYAVNDPGKAESEIGAIRERFQEPEWQEGVLKLMNKARLIIYRPATSRGTLWEFDQIVNYGYLHKTIIAVSKDDLLDYKNFCRKIQPGFSDLFPFEDDELYIHIDENKEIYYSNKMQYLTVYKEFIAKYKQIDSLPAPQITGVG